MKHNRKKQTLHREGLGVGDGGCQSACLILIMFCVKARSVCSLQYKADLRKLIGLAFVLVLFWLDELFKCAKITEIYLYTCISVAKIVRANWNIPRSVFYEKLQGINIIVVGRGGDGGDELRNRLRHYMSVDKKWSMNFVAWGK